MKAKYKDRNGDTYHVSFELGLYRCECYDTGDRCNFPTLPKGWRKVK